MGFWTNFSGKPSGILTVGTSYRNLDVRSAAATQNGVESHLLYLNIEPVFATGRTVGVVRVRYTRDPHGSSPADSTGYNDFTIHRDALIGGRFLITHLHEERGQRGRNGRWALRCGGGITQLRVRTRYEKVSVVW